jgi:hypothetical protein
MEDHGSAAVFLADLSGLEASEGHRQQFTVEEHVANASSPLRNGRNSLAR